MAAALIASRPLRSNNLSRRLDERSPCLVVDLAVDPAEPEDELSSGKFSAPDPAPALVKRGLTDALRDDEGERACMASPSEAQR